jgi:antitoxin VapB
MTTAKVINNDQYQIVRLPKEFHMRGDRVKISHFKNGVLLEPISETFDDLIESLEQFSDDFMSEERNQPKHQERERSRMR